MPDSTGMKTKYMVWKLEDLVKVCTPQDFRLLDTIIDRVLRQREEEGKGPVNKYIVVNRDEPYADEVIEILKRNGHWG